MEKRFIQFSRNFLILHIFRSKYIMMIITRLVLLSKSLNLHDNLSIRLTSFWNTLNLSFFLSVCKQSVPAETKNVGAWILYFYNAVSFLTRFNCELQNNFQSFLLLSIVEWIFSQISNPYSCTCTAGPYLCLDTQYFVENIPLWNPEILIWTVLKFQNHWPNKIRSGFTKLSRIL